MSFKALRLDGNLQRGKVVRVQIDGEPVTAYEGETVATVLMAAGRRTFGQTPNDQPRGLFCGIGLCYDCLVTIDGINNQRACATPVREGMHVGTVPASLEGRG